MIFFVCSFQNIDIYLVAVTESTRSWFIVLALLGLWMPPIYWIAMLILLVSFGAAMPTSMKVFFGLICFFTGGMIISIIAGSSNNYYDSGYIGWLLIGLPTFASFLTLVEIIFVAAGSLMITESFKDTNSEKVRLRNARGSNLAWNIAGLIIFSLFNWIGIPVTLTGLSKYSDKPGWSSVRIWGMIALCVDIVSWVVFGVLWGVSVSYTYYYGAKRNVEFCASSCQTYRSYPAFFDFWWIWLILYLARFCTIITFIVLADNFNRKMLDEQPDNAGMVVNSGAGVDVSQAVVSPCPSCQAPLQYTSSGGSTKVQCYQCQAIVEFTAAS